MAIESPAILAKEPLCEAAMRPNGKAPYLGQKVEDTASYQVRFPGLVPIVATVDLKLLSQSSYSMHVTCCLGVTMMDVVFNRTARR